jgi:hypothetical protein
MRPLDDNGTFINGTERVVASSCAARCLRDGTLTLEAGSPPT